MNSRTMFKAQVLLYCWMGAAVAWSQGAPKGQPNVGVAPQYDTTHVYVAPSDVDSFVKCFLATFGGKSTEQVIVTVTPTPSKTTSQLLQTPSGTVSLFGFSTPIPFGFGGERNGYLVTDMKTALSEARKAGADVIVQPFSDPIGMDAVVQWPGGVNLQLYWHTTPPSYAAFAHIPENRVYVSPDHADAFLHAFLKFSHGRITHDDPNAPGSEIGSAGTTYRRIQLESVFGKMVVFVTNGQLSYPYGKENTGYEVDDLNAVLEKAKANGATVLVQPHQEAKRRSSIVQFPGGYVTEIHALKP